MDLREFSKCTDSKYGEIANGYLEIKKSKFYSYIFNVNEIDKVEEILKDIRKDNKKARHLVYAYNFTSKDNIKYAKFSNDNEPQGTGVNSIISMLEKESTEDYLVVVVRYFGGTLLGAGPLLRSYLNSFKDAYEKLKK